MFGDNSLPNLIRKTAKFGNKHLVNPDHGNSLRTAYDLDIKAVFVLVLLALVKMLRAFFTAICSKHKTSQKPSKAESEAKPNDQPV